MSVFPLTKSITLANYVRTLRAIGAPLTVNTTSPKYMVARMLVLSGSIGAGMLTRPPGRWSARL